MCYPVTRSANQIVLIGQKKAFIANLSFVLSNDYDLLIAEDGDETLDILDRKGADLILLNKILPESKIFDFLKKLRKKEVVSLFACNNCN